MVRSGGPLWLVSMLTLNAGCTSDHPPVPDAPAAGVPITAAFVPARDDQVIEVTARDRMAITAAALVMQDGSRTVATSIDAVADPSESSDRAIDPANAQVPGSLDQPLGGAMTETTTVIGEIASSAQIRVAYPADYAAGWQKAHIEVEFGRGGGGFSETVPAPPPP